MLTNFIFDINGITFETLSQNEMFKYVLLNSTFLAKLFNLFKSNPISSTNLILANKGIIWDGLHDFILLIVKIYQLRIYDINEFEEDLGKELKRMKCIRKKTPYIRDYPRKLKYPE